MLGKLPLHQQLLAGKGRSPALKCFAKGKLPPFIAPIISQKRTAKIVQQIDFILSTVFQQFFFSSLIYFYKEMNVWNVDCGILFFLMWNLFNIIFTIFFSGRSQSNRKHLPNSTTCNSIYFLSVNMSKFSQHKVSFHIMFTNTAEPHGRPFFNYISILICYHYSHEQKQEQS